MLPPPLKTSPLKTSTCSNICSCRGTHFAATPFTFSLISSTPGAAFSTFTTPTSTENVGIYSVITTFTRVNIVCK